MDDQDRQKMRMKMTIVLLTGIMVLGVSVFFMFDRETGAGADTSSGDSSFPWVAVFIPIFIVPAIVAKQRRESGRAEQMKRKRDDMEKPKRRPEYLRTADGDLLEVVEEQEKSKRE